MEKVYLYKILNPLTKFIVYLSRTTSMLNAKHEQKRVGKRLPVLPTHLYTYGVVVALLSASALASASQARLVASVSLCFCRHWRWQKKKNGNAARRYRIHFRTDIIHSEMCADVYVYIHIMAQILRARGNLFTPNTIVVTLRNYTHMEFFKFLYVLRGLGDLSDRFSEIRIEKLSRIKNLEKHLVSEIAKWQLFALNADLNGKLSTFCDRGDTSYVLKHSHFS